MKNAINFTEDEYRTIFKAASILKMSVRDFVKRSKDNENARLVNQAEASNGKVVRLDK